MTQSTRRPELVLPAGVLAAIHEAAAEHGDGTAILERFGTSLGRPVFEALTGKHEDDPGVAAADDFWAGLRDYLSSHGWGTVSHERIHPGLGRVRAVDWVEPEVADGGSPVTAGLLAGLFTAVAGQSVEVLEAPRSDEEPDPAFLFGSPEAIRTLRGQLDDGMDLAGALERL